MAQQKPQPHRCNDHLEDVLSAVVHFRSPLAALGTFTRCLRSKPGAEPPRIGAVEPKETPLEPSEPRENE